MANVIAAHDLSGVGRCSLTTALSVLPAFGHVCQPLPTALLNMQTAFPGYSFVDFTEHMPDYLEGWRGLSLDPAMIYTGFLGGAAQPAMLAELALRHSDAVCVVDPVMGDGGRLYPCFDLGFVSAMRGLIRAAHIILPNTTEFNLLSGRDPASALPEDTGELLAAAGAIGSEKLRAVVVTSAKTKDGMCNLVITPGKGLVRPVPCRNNLVHYSGAGDLFASVLCALMLNGRELTEAVRLAADFVADSVDMAPPGHDPRCGAPYELLLAAFAAKHTATPKQLTER